jgi:hypothetical protein
MNELLKTYFIFTSRVHKVHSWAAIGGLRIEFFRPPKHTKHPVRIELVEVPVHPESVEGTELVEVPPELRRGFDRLSPNGGLGVATFGKRSISYLPRKLT